MFIFEASKIKEVMTAKGWTAEQCASHAGVTRQTLGNILSGRTSGNVSTLLAICNATGTQPGYFFAQSVKTDKQ